MEFDKCIIIDFGTLETKTGFNYQEDPTEPKCRFKTRIEERSVLERGRAKNKKDYDILLERTFKELEAETDDHAVVIAEPVHFPKAHKEYLGKLLFEKHDVEAVCFVPQGVLNFHSVGKTTGLFVELGEGLIQFSPIFKGYLVNEAVDRMVIGGKDITDEFVLALKERGETSVGRELVREWKEGHCYVAPDFEEEKRKWKEGQIKTEEVELPDGKKIQLGVELFRSPELLFSTGHMDIPNTPQTAGKCIKTCGMDARQDLFSNVYISGGCVNIPGFRLRFWDELKKFAPRADLVRVREHPNEYSVFHGATVLSSLSSFDEEYFAKEDYEEEGIKAIHKKKKVKEEEDLGSDSSDLSSSDDDE